MHLELTPQPSVPLFDMLEIVDGGVRASMSGRHSCLLHVEALVY